MINNKKYIDLIQYLKALGSVVIAFSGGVDSTFLVKVAKEALGDKVLAITINAPYTPKWEMEEAKELVKSLGIRHEFIEVPLLEEIRFNPSDRCYICKKAIFTKIKEVADKENIKWVLDGTNADDTKDYRPGIRALKELEIISPLLENNITKEEIRRFSKELKLETWEKPAYACLLSRIPYGDEIKIKELDKIEASERYLMELGFIGVRVRNHKDVARIELQKSDMDRFFNEDIIGKVSKRLKEYGYKYVTLDLSGYEMGSLNDSINFIKMR